MKFSIIGTGFIFPKHVEAIKSVGGEIVEAIGEGSLLSWQEIIKNPQTDCIVILAPNNLHFEMALASAKEGKTVLCEKPLALSSKEVKELMNYPNIFTVAQLRYHPAVKELKEKIFQKENYKINIDISVHRDKNYFQSWKGRKEKSGGILFNLGIHYFDLLLYLFGEPIEILTESLTDRRGEGVIKGKNYLCNWRISAEAPKENQHRVFKINGINYNFSATENLHFYVYKGLLEGRGITPQEALKSIELIEKIYQSYKKDIKKSLVITLFAYNFPHKKTTDFIIKLHSLGYKFKVIAQNFKKLPLDLKVKEPTKGLHPRKLCEKLGIEYIVRDHNDSIDLLEGIGVIAGARILSKEVVNKIPIINLHPAILPYVRGLNAVEKSIKMGVTPGVTAHIIDEKIDAGEILIQKKIKKYKDIEDLKEKIYQLQLEMLPKAIELCTKEKNKKNKAICKICKRKYQKKGNKVWQTK